MVSYWSEHLFFSTLCCFCCGWSICMTRQTYSVTLAPFSSVLIMWLCIPAGEPGLGFVPAEADGVGVEPHDVGRHTHTGGPSPETAPLSGRGETQVPQPGRAAHPAAAVSPDLHWLTSTQHRGWFVFTALQDLTQTQMKTSELVRNLNTDN